MRKWAYVPMFSVVMGEILIFYGKILFGLGLHSINFLTILLFITFGKLPLETKNVLRSLTLLPILGFINFSMPAFTNIHLRYLLISGIMLIPIYSVFKSYQLLKERTNLKTSFGLFYIYLPFIILIVTMIVMFINIISVQIISADIINIGGKLLTILLIVFLSISLLIADTKYDNNYNSSFINTCSGSLFLVFVVIVLFNIN